MNLILICSDTFRADYLGCYGNEWIQTPYLDQLASEGALFEDAYAEALPTIPVRRVLLTGRRCFPFAHYPQPDDIVQCPGWHPLFAEDVTLSEALREQGYTNAFVTDVYHMMKPGKNFHRGFHCWRWIRGQEADPYTTGPKCGVDLDHWLMPAMAEAAWERWVSQYLMSARDWKTEEDTFVAQVMREAATWLSMNCDNRPFFMYVDCFDPHEPWHAPKEYADKYYPNYEGRELICPPGKVDQMSPEEFERVKALYAGEVTLTDRWIGYLLERLDALNLADDTVVVFTADHGCMMGEQDEVHKGADRLRHQVTRVPLIVRTPDRQHAGKKLKGFVQHQDIMPTVMKLLGVPAPDRVNGEDFWPMVTDGAPGLRDTVVTAFGGYASVRTKDWSFQTPWTGPTRKQQQARKPELYDRNADPDELTSVIADHRDVADQLHAKLKDYIARGLPETQGTFMPGAMPEICLDIPPSEDQALI